MYKLVFYVPEDHVENVKQALFKSGAGRIGNYDQCCWQTLGQGQFRPLAGAEPFLGEREKLEYVAEYKVELVCEDALIFPAVKALKKTHPYEEPAYEVYKLENI
ncbi:MAG: YqfO family protein [Pseudomonadales bacterium]|nr:YqfO family protein [Pseudomonadales bacterium]